MLHSLVAKVTGRNPKFTPASAVVQQLNEPRPLPMGRKEFEEWSDRIISGALIPNEDGLKACHDEDLATEEQKEKLKIFKEGQKYVLANMLLHLGPTESHKPDAFFIHSLRKVTINQVAHTISKEIHDEGKARTAAKEATKAQNEDSKG